MRKFVLCLCIGWFLFTDPGLAQTQSLEQKVSVNKTDTQIEEVLNYLTSKYKINFSYSKDLVSLQQKVTLNAVDLPLKEVLNNIFNAKGIQYVVVGDQIALQKNSKPIVATDAQTLKGQVLIYGTDNPIGYASIYFNSMYKGTVSNDDGYFELTLHQSIKDSIIVSAIGYSTATVAEYSTQQPIKVYLKPKAYDLDAVTIESSSGISRQKKEKIFKKEFLGTSQNGLKCRIENLSDIQLVYKKKSKTLEAFCDKPVIIHNPQLGYKITYYIDKFNTTGELTANEGHYFFEDDTLLSKRDRKKINQRRKSAYQGSRMHFIRSLCSNTLNEAGFTVIGKGRGLLDPSDLLDYGDSQKFIKIGDGIDIYYLHIGKTYVTDKKSLSLINDKGFHDPSSITWIGYMADERVGDLLPYEYLLEKK
ncbi:MAG TPA: STN and carboxypeptidase regulatory-like domain-containing protein [Pedobacter sp.]|jgi:hypothetical protein